MFSIKCQELVKTQQITSNVDYLTYNQTLLKYHQELLDLHTGSRSVCVYEERPTRVRCTKCLKCKGNILYDLWCINEHIQDCLSILNNNMQDLELKENCFYYLKRYRNKRTKRLKEARKHGL